jgi:hypothetical protein
MGAGLAVVSLAAPRSQPKLHPQFHDQRVFPGAHVVVAGHQLLDRFVDLFLLIPISECIGQSQSYFFGFVDGLYVRPKRPLNNLRRVVLSTVLWFY